LPAFFIGAPFLGLFSWRKMVYLWVVFSLQFRRDHFGSQMSAAGRKKLSESELLAFSREHLRYELDMLFSTAEILGRMQTSATPTPFDTLVTNAWLESFVIHLRNVIEFLYPQRLKENSVIAEDFFPDPLDWKKTRPKMTSAIKNARQRAHTELSHLTTTRLTVKNWQWPSVELAK